MRSVQDISNFPNYGQKFQSPKGDTTFTIFHGAGTFVVDIHGNVISPVNTPLNYCHTDLMEGNQSGYTGIVKDFLTVSPDLDEPGNMPY